MSAEPPVSEDDLVVEANPERALFVEMLTRDIDLIPAVMDLLDNSVDGARSDGSNLDQFAVELQVSATKFEISDNCGGIDLDVARRYAFRFGRPAAYKGSPRSVGQFGVGMKRALFKLGDEFTVDSRAATTRFVMTVDVAEWMQETGNNWTFRMSSASRSYDSETGGRGTTITVAKLHNAVGGDMSAKTFQSLLREQIRFRHQEALADGLRIYLNGEKLSGLQQELLSGPNFSPVNRTFVVASDHGDVAVRIIAGVIDVERRDVGRDDGNAEDFRGGGDAGWWIFCNGRLLLMREHTRLTGWGESLPNYHPQYREFRGYAYLNAPDTAALPWNTTKTGLDEESQVWRQVQAQIKIAGGEVVGILNRLKSESQSAANDDDMPTVQAARAAVMVKTADLAQNDAFRAPPPRPPRKKTSQRKAKVKHLQFDVPLGRFQEVAQRLNTEVVAEVGRRTFDYYYEREFDV